MNAHAILKLNAIRRGHPPCPTCGTRCVTVDAFWCCGFCETCETWQRVREVEGR